MSGIDAMALRHTCLQILSKLDALARAEKLSVTQWFALRLLSAGAATTAAELHLRLGYDPGAMSRVIDSLVRRSLLIKERSLTDRRRVQLTATREGKIALARMEPDLQNLLRSSCVAGISEPAKATASNAFYLKLQSC